MYPLSKKTLFLAVLFLQIFFMFDYFNSLYMYSFMLIVKGFVIFKLYQDTFQISLEKAFGEFSPKKVIKISLTLLIIELFLYYIFELLKINGDSSIFIFDLRTIIYFIAHSFAFSITNIVLLRLLSGSEYDLSFNVSTIMIIILNILPNMLNFTIGTIPNIVTQVIIIFVLNKLYIQSKSMVNYFYVLVTYNLLILLLQAVFNL